MTVAAAAECGNGLGESRLPEDVRSRNYTAVVEQNDETLLVTPTGPGFPPEYAQGFYGTLNATGAAFLVRNLDDGQPIAEQLSNSRIFMIEGRVAAEGSPVSRLAGTLSGEFYLFETPSWRRIAWCSSTSHQFVLSR